MGHAHRTCYRQIISLSGKSCTIQESNQASGVRKAHYALHSVRTRSILLAQMGVRKISFVAYGISPIKIHYFDYSKRFTNRINEVYAFVCLFIDALWSPAGKGLPLLSFVMSYCEVVTFPLVSWVRCGA